MIYSTTAYFLIGFIIILHLFYCIGVTATVILTSAPPNGVINSSLTFTCDTSSHMPTVLLWSKTSPNGSNIAVATLNSTCHHLIVSNFTTYTYTCIGSIYTLTIPASSMTVEEDGYKWTCKAVDGGLKSSNTVYLSVSVPVSNVMLTSVPSKASPVDVINGISSRFHCQANTNAKPSAMIQWYRGTTNLTSQGTGDQISVSFNKVDSEFKCRGWNNVTSTPYPESTIGVNVLYEPTLQSMSSIKIIRRQTVTVQCIVTSANPMPLSSQYSWRQISGTLRQTGQTLSIPDVQTSHNGSYQCTAVNTMVPTNGQSQQGSDNENFDLDVLYPPQVTSINDQTTKVGDTLNVICSATGNPAPNDGQFMWTKLNDENFHQLGRTLYISSIQRSDAGTYKCTAVNSMQPTHGTAQPGSGSTQFDLDVLYPPSGTPALSPKSASFNESSTVTYSCQFQGGSDGNPRATWSWSCPGNVNNNTPGKTMISFQAKKSDHDKVCYCWAISDELNYNKSDSVVVDVKYAPSGIPRLDIRTLVYNETNIISMKCSINDGNPRVSWSWSCGGNPVTSNIINVAGSSTLTITATKELNRKQCSCRATSSYGPYDQTVSSGMLNIQFPPEVKPTLNTIPNNQHYDDQTLVSVTCTMEGGNPAATLTWSCLGVPVMTNINFSNATSAVSTLSLTLNKTYNGKSCKCRATHFLGGFNEETIKTFHVFFAPIITNPSFEEGSAVVSEGTRVVIKCHVEGNPTPHVTWKDKSAGHVIHYRSPDNDATRLRIESAQCLNTTTFSVSVNNSKGSTSKEVNLNVTCIPKEDMRHEVGKVVAVTDDKQLNIMLRVLSNPQPKSVTWHFTEKIQNETSSSSSDGIAIVDDTRTNMSITKLGAVEYQTVLSRANMEMKDFGFYEINMESYQGDVTKIQFEAISQRQPDAPANVTASCDTPQNAVVYWKSKFNGLGITGQQTFQVLYRKEKNKEFILHPKIIDDPGENKYLNESITLPSGSWVFKVMSSNKFGNATSMQTMYCTVIDFKATETSSQTVAIAAGVSAAIVCALIVISALFVFRRIMKKRNGKETDDNGRALANLSADNDDNDGIKDNILYVSAGPNVAETSGNTDFYAEVVKKPKMKKGENKEKISDVYAEVQKPVKKGKKGKGAPKKKGIPGPGDVYENVEEFSKQPATSNEAVYSNNSAKEARGTRNQDGLLYVEVDLRPVPEERRNVIIGEEERTDYASVDFVLPESDAKK